MTHTTHQSLVRAARSQDGMALLIAVIVLLLMSALGLAALQHAGDEASGSGRARRKDATLYAADSGIKMIQVKLLTTYVASPTMSPVNLDEPTLVKDGFGNPIAIRSGAPQNGTIPAAPASIAADPNVPSENAEGYMLNQGNQGSQQFRPVRADVTALDIANGMVHLQAQFSVLEGSGGGSY
jgi:type IV pilus assembly PilX-like protein